MKGFENSKETMKESKKKQVDLFKESQFVNMFFHFLTITCYIGTGVMISNYYNYWDERLAYKPEVYEIPKFSDFGICILSIPFLCLFRLVFQNTLTDFTYKNFLSAKFKDCKDEENYKMGEIYKKKLVTSFFKATYYIIIVSFAYYGCRNADYFPYELGGNGDIINIYKNGGHGYLYFYKPLLFKYYYLISLGYVITDLIWLLFINDSQSDFPIMLLHHSTTISLIAFSYLSNLSQIGITVLFLHDFTDILVYLIRIVINTDMKQIYKHIFSTLFLLSYIYMRIYVFGKLILLCFLNFTDWNMFAYTLFGFKCILMIMHIYWVYEILIRICSKNLVDTSRVKKK